MWSTIYIALAAALIPLSFVLVWAMNEQDPIIAILWPTGILIMGIYAFYRSRQHIQIEQRKHNEERKEVFNLLKSIAKELKGVRRDLKERKKPPAD